MKRHHEYSIRAAGFVVCEVDRSARLLCKWRGSFVHLKIVYDAREEINHAT